MKINFKSVSDVLDWPKELLLFNNIFNAQKHNLQLKCAKENRVNVQRSKNHGINVSYIKEK